MSSMPSRPPGWRKQLLRVAGVNLFSDLYERASSLGVPFPILPDGKRRRLFRTIEAAGALFIHIPKNAGMAISQALYGEQVFHPTIRYYGRFAPRLVETLPSFAVWRDPVERFLSAYRFARTGGNAGNRIDPAFREAYVAFNGVDAALDHIEGAHSVFALDHVFRPQFWYVADRAARIAVDRLCLIDQLGEALADMALPGMGHVTHLNETAAVDLEFGPRQEDRLRRLYAIDFAIHESLQAQTMPSILNSPQARRRFRY